VTRRESTPEEIEAAFPESIGVGRAMLQGAVVEAPTTWGSMVDAGGALFGGIRRAGERAIMGPTLAGVAAGEREPEEFDLSGRANRAGKKALSSVGMPYREPRGAMRYLQRVTGGAVAAAPFAALPIGGFGVPARLAMETGSGGLSALSSLAAADLGAGEGGQVAAGVVGGLLPPSAVVGSRLLGGAGGLARDATRLVPGMSKSAAMRDASNMLAAPLTRGDPRRLERAIAMLSEEERRSLSASGQLGPPPFEDVGQATTVQALRSEFPEIEKLESTIGRESADYQGMATDRRAANLAAAGERIESLTQDVPPQAVGRRLEEEIAQNQKDEQAAYGAVDEMGVRGSTEPLHRGLKRITRVMGDALADEIPARQARTIRDAYTETVEVPLPTGGSRKQKIPADVNLGELHNFRKSVNADLERLSRAPEGRQYEISNLMALKKSVDEALEAVSLRGDVGADEVAKLRHAIDLMHRYESVYSGHAAIDAFRKHVDQPERALSDALRAVNPGAEMENLVLALRGDRNASEGLNRLYLRWVLLGERSEGEISNIASWVGNVNMAQRRLAKSKSAGRVLFGQEGMRSLRRFLERVGNTTSGNVGTGKQAHSTQSGVATGEQIGIKTPTAQTVTKWMFDKLMSRYRHDLGELLEGALLRPEVMRRILENPKSPSQFEAWAQKVEDTYERSFGRPLSTAKRRTQKAAPLRYPARAVGELREEDER
jgi:hypothetical protein